MNDLPADVLRKLERRWASRLARDAAAWSQKLPDASHKKRGPHRAPRPHERPTALETPVRRNA